MKMNVIFLFFTGVIIGITGAVIPGPLTLFTVSEVIKSNRFAGLKIMLGHIISEFTLVLIIFLGLHNFLKSAAVLKITGAIGGLALVVMGVILFIKHPSVKSLKAGNDKTISSGLVMGGIAFSIASPGFIVWWATIGISTVMRSLLYGVIGIMILLAGHWLADIAWYWSLSYAVEKGRDHLNDKTYQKIVKSLSILLILLGIYFICQSFFLTL